MAYDDPRIKHLYFDKTLVAQVWNTHAGLGWTNGKFRWETSDPLIKEFLQAYALFHESFEDGQQKWEEGIQQLELQFGAAMMNEGNWKLIVAETATEQRLLLPPLPDTDLGNITLKIDYAD